MTITQARLQGTALDVPPPIAPLADAFARRIVAWAADQTVPPDAATLATLKRAARALSLASTEGHVCLPLSSLLSPSDPRDQAPESAAAAPCDSHDDRDLAALRAALLASGMVGTPDQPGVRPLILDPHHRLYLHRHFDLERRLARRLLQACESESDPVDSGLAAQFRAQFPSLASQPEPGAATEPDWQAVAVGLALMRRLVIISGGPGTGKTTTLVKLLACLLEQDPQTRIALAAPTGKAAARMTEAIRLRAEFLPAPLRARMPQESFTVHRLLGVLPDESGFLHHAGNPLPCDTLVVDEASMLDLALATRLLEALPLTGRIVLLGDKDQLASVEAGAVFAELSRSPALSLPCREALSRLCETSVESLDQGTEPTTDLVPYDGHSLPGKDPALPDSVVWLRRTYRFSADSGIGQLARCIRRGDADTLMACLQPDGDPALAWVDLSREAGPTALQHCLNEGWRPYLDAVRNRAPCDALFDAFERFRVLCAVRDGPLGTIALNAAIAARIRAAGGASSLSDWYPGRAVMVLRNDYVLRRFNGDVGIAWPDADGQFQVWFADATQGLRAVSPARLPPHEDAYAMTVHKSQGSEFDAVAVVLPEPSRRGTSREQLYTAVTRARHAVTVCASKAALCRAVQSPTRRDSGLLTRIAEQAGVMPPRQVPAS